MTFLTLDVGSSSARAILFDDQFRGDEHHIASRKYNFDVTPDGGSTIDASFLRQQVEACLDEVLAHLPANPIRAVGMATFVGNLLGVDASGKPITPIYTYADSRSREDVDILSGRIDTEQTRQRTGCPLHTAYHPARLHWLKRTQPTLYNKVHRWTDFGSYLYATWFGKANCSYSVASWSGLLNRQTLTWDADWLKLLGLTDTQFPPLADFSDTQSGLSSGYTSRWSSLKQTPFFLAVGDGAGANVGTGATTSSELAITLGTTAAVRVLYASPDKTPDVPQGLWAYRLDKTHHLIGGALTEGGSTFQWLEKLFPSMDFAQAQKTIAERPADAHGLTCLPLLNGERSPGWHTNATGTVHGLRLSTTPTDIYQATLEGVAMRIAQIAEQLPSLPETIYVSGGAAVMSHIWVQMICNALNCSVQLVDVADVTALGVAIAMKTALDGISMNTYKPTSALTFTPHPDNVSRMKAASARQHDLYHRLYDKGT